MRGPLLSLAALLVGALIGATLMPAAPAAPAPIARPPTPALVPPSVEQGEDIEQVSLPPRTYSRDGKLGPSRAACPSEGTACLQPTPAPPAEVALDGPMGFARLDAVVSWVSEAPAGTPLEVSLLACRNTCGPGATVLATARSPEDKRAPGASRLTLSAPLDDLPANVILVVRVAYADQVPGAPAAHVAEGQAFHVEARLS